MTLPTLLTALASPKTTRDERDRRLNIQLGLLLTETLSPALRETLSGIQHELLERGGELAMPSHAFIHETNVLRQSKVN